MTNYLVSQFNIPYIDAFSMAWSGLGDSQAYQENSSFRMEDGTYVSKDDLIYPSDEYMGGLKGTEMCDQ